LTEELDEVSLINLARTDPEAFGVLYERYVERIYNYVYFRVGNPNDAEDLTSKVFFKALKSIGGYKHMGLPFSAWLYRIAHNLVANYHRDRLRAKEISIENLTIPDTGRHPLRNKQSNRARKWISCCALSTISVRKSGSWYCLSLCKI